MTGLRTSGANLREIGLAMACRKGGSGPAGSAVTLMTPDRIALVSRG